MRKPSTTISFRADSEILEQIDIARKPFEISRGDWVRGVVVSRVFESDRQGIEVHFETIQQAIETLQDQLRDERKFHARILFALLTEVGSLSPDDAKTIVRRIIEL